MTIENPGKHAFRGEEPVETPYDPEYHVHHTDTDPNNPEAGMEAAALDARRINGISNELRSNLFATEEDITMLSLAAVIRNAHILTQGPPGVGKTTIAKTLARITGGSFGRIQGGEDLTPSDITGSEVYNLKTGEFEFVAGPIFADYVLSDEFGLLRSQARAGLIEGMEEGTVTVGTETHLLPPQHKVVATQNKIEDYRSRISGPNRDRFAIGLELRDLSEAEMLKVAALDRNPQQKINRSSLEPLQERISKVVASPAYQEFIASFIVEMRKLEFVDQEATVLGGARPLLNILHFAKANAVRRIASEINMDDVKLVAKPVLRHRVAFLPKVGDPMNFDEVYDDLFAKIEKPQVTT